MEHSYHTLRQRTQCHVIGGEHAEVASFRRNYIAENRPCLLAADSTGFGSWRAKQEWASPQPSHTQEVHRCTTSNCSSLSSSSVTEFHSELLAAKRLILSSAYPATDERSPYPATTSVPNFASLLRLCEDMHQSVLIAEIKLPQSIAVTSQAETSAASSSPVLASSQQQIHAYGSNTAEGSMRSFFLQWQSTIDARTNVGSFSSPSIVHYLKDWHLCLTHPKYDAYRTPLPVRDDWMNWFHLSSSSAVSKHSAELSAHFPSRVSLADDFRFCYMGERATFTPLHADVYNSYSWSTNIVGRKLWVMFHPDWRPFLSDDSGTLINDVLAGHQFDASLISLSQQRVLEIAEKYSTTKPQADSSSSSSTSTSTLPLVALPPCYVWIQLEGETLFVPSGWLHQVHNLDDCISINHNWMNACNLQNMYLFLQREWREALEAVQGFDFNAGMKSMDSSSGSVKAPEQLDPITVENASRVMHSSVGMSWDEFHAFLRFHRSRIECSTDDELQECAMDRESAANSIIIIDQVIQQMKRDGILKLIDVEYDDYHSVESSQDQISSQLGQLTLSEVAAENPADTDSEDEFPIRRRRMASGVEGQARRRRVIRDDDDEEDDAFEDLVEEELGDEADAVEQVENYSLCEEQPGLSAPAAPLSFLSDVPHADSCSASVNSRSTPLVDVKPKFEPDIPDLFDPRRVLSFTLSLYFQQAHAYFQLPSLPDNILELVSEYAIPTAIISASFSSAVSSSYVPVLPPRSRGPFFVVQTHYANGVTFSEEYLNVEELLGGIQMFVQDCWRRIQLVKQEREESFSEVQEALKQLCTALDAFKLKHASRPSSSESSSPSLDEIFELTLALGDTMIEFQVGYGWTFLHECEHL